MALRTTLVSCARARDSLLSVSVRRALAVFSTPLDLRAEKSRVVKHLKHPHCGKASKKLRVLSWDRF